MKIVCSHCGKNFTIHESKLPKEAARVRFKCPACGQVNILETDPQRIKQGSEGESTVGSLEDRQDIQTRAAQQEVARQESVEPDLFPPGAKTAFVFVTDHTWLQTARQWLQEQGFYISEASTVTEACQKLRLNDYHLVLIEDCPENNLLLQEVNSWAGNVRRQVNVLLVGAKGRSFDPGQAFVQGVNQYLSLGDLDKAAELLTQAQEDFERMLEPWTMAGSGQG